MILELVRKGTKIRNFFIFMILVLGIAGLIYMNRTGKEYRMFNQVDVLTEGNDIETQRLSLPKGTYYMVVNYVVSEDIPVTVYIDQEHQIEDTLVKNTENGYYTLSFEVEKSTSLFHLIFADGAIHDFQMYNYEMTADRVLYNDDTYYAIVFILLALSIYILLQCKVVWEMSAKRKTIILTLVALTLFSSYPMFTNYLVHGHDLLVHLMRIEGVKDALADGQFPAMIYPDSNNGYGTLGFTYPTLFLYFPALLRMCNVSMVTAYQSLIIMINAATAAAIFLSVKSVSDSDYASLIASVLYMLAPYRLSDLYVRSALGESLAMIFLPITLAGLFHIFLGEKKKWYLLVIGYSGILQSHMLSCLLIAFVSLIVGLVLVRHLFRERRIFSLLKAIGLFLGVNLWYMIPFWAYSQNPLGMRLIENPDFYEDAVFLGQLFMTKSSTYVPLGTAEGIG
ncbi:MAG TPA: hypothetical protein PLU43_06300, partial [Lachnospiraceae bacterium]|nr:hypothetical protein [Lachnospiraceae bacterium]